MIHLKLRHHSSSLSCMSPGTTARVLAATLTGAALFVSAPARADYSACMTFCLDEHNFSYCHPICDGSASSAGTVGETGDTGGTESVAPLFTAESCGTLDERERAISLWVKEKFGPVVMMSGPLDDDVSFALDFFLYEDGEFKDRCIGIVTFDDACRMFETEQFECAPYE